MLISFHSLLIWPTAIKYFLFYILVVHEPTPVLHIAQRNFNYGLQALLLDLQIY